MKLLTFLALISLAPAALAGGYGPWSFGMTVAQIRAVTSHGPYRSFPDGGLETYNATFCSKEEDVQFYLKNDHLWRIGVVTYEGISLDAATKDWMWTYNCLTKQYGALFTPGLKGKGVQALANEAETMVKNGKKVQMAPVTQSKDDFIYSDFLSYDVKGVTFYRVWVNYDVPSS